MTRIFTELITRNLDNERFVQLVTPFIFDSDVLKKAGLPFHVVVPTDFVQDFESIPIVRGSNKRGGTAHDYLCRIDSIPKVTKAQAAAVYREIMAYTYQIDDKREAGFVNGLKDDYYDLRDWLKRWGKWLVVRIAWGYFHKFKVLTTAKEICGLDCDPYVTMDKLDIAIKQSKETTAGIKDIPAQVEQKVALVKESEQVTTNLQDAKTEIKESVK